MCPIELTSGEFAFDARPARSDPRTLRDGMRFVFGDPFSSLDPRMTVSTLAVEPLECRAPGLLPPLPNPLPPRPPGLRRQHEGA